MVSRCSLVCGLLLAVFSVSLGLHAKKVEASKYAGWGYVSSGSVEVRSKPSLGKRGFSHLGQGALVAVLKYELHGGTDWAQVLAPDLPKLDFRPGWVESKQLEVFPLARFPSDSDLVSSLGGEFLDEAAASHAKVVRFLVRRGSLSPALIALVNSRLVPSELLVAFFPRAETYAPGPSLEFPSSEMTAGVLGVEVRDLLGDGNDCLVTREPFRVGPENRGVRLVIRRLEDDSLQTLWKAPVEYRNLEAYPARARVLEPPENNIGAPGTVTTGEVTFRSLGRAFEPLWKGKVEFFVPGRDAPVDSRTIEIACPWDGSKFRPMP